MPTKYDYAWKRGVFDPKTPRKWYHTWFHQILYFSVILIYIIFFSTLWAEKFTGYGRWHSAVILVPYDLPKKHYVVSRHGGDIARGLKVVSFVILALFGQRVENIYIWFIFDPWAKKAEKLFCKNNCNCFCIP